MGHYRNISMYFWTDSKVDDDFTPEDKYFYLYLLTNPHTNICGCYEISMKQMERETGYNSDTVRRLLKRMEETHNVIRFSAETKEVLILNWYKYNWSKSDKLQKAVEAAVQHIKCEQFRFFIISKLRTDTIQNTDNREQIQRTETESDTDTDVSIGYQYPIDTVSEPEKPKKHRSIFIPPTHEEVAAYCRERGNSVDANRFVDFYSSKGWMVGISKMKDWKAAVRTWEQRDAQNRPQGRRDTPHGGYADDTIF